MIEIVRMMLVKRANERDVTDKSGIIVPLFKKGDRKCMNNYRDVCLLSMCSRILARVIAKGLAWWAEWLGLLDDNQEVDSRRAANDGANERGCGRLQHVSK